MKKDEKALKKSKRKLKVNRETLRVLTPNELGTVVEGIVNSEDSDCCASNRGGHCVSLGC